jgi:hypothetical protein
VVHRHTLQRAVPSFDPVGPRTEGKSKRAEQVHAAGEDNTFSLGGPDGRVHARRFVRKYPAELPCSCSSCAIVKPLASSFPSPQTTNGFTSYQSQCRACAYKHGAPGALALFDSRRGCIGVGRTNLQVNFSGKNAVYESRAVTQSGSPTPQCRPRLRASVRVLSAARQVPGLWRTEFGPAWHAGNSMQEQQHGDSST